MATGCDVAESDVTGSDVIRLKVDDCPWGVILIVRGVVWYSKCVFYHVGVLTVVFLLNNLRAADRGKYAAAAAADRDIHRRQKDMCRRCHSSSNTQSNVGEPYYILKTNVLGSRRIRSRSFHAMGTSVYQCDCRTYRQ